MGLLKEIRETERRLTEKLENLPAYESCENSEIPNGRVWCSFYDQTFAGRCNTSCPGYKNKFLSNAA